MAVFGTGAVGPGGVADSRTIVLDNSVLGYDPFTAGSRPNLADVISMAAVGNVGEERGEVCFTGSARGSAGNPQIELKAVTTQCAWVSENNAATIVLNHHEGYWQAELRLTDGSYVGAGTSVQGSAWGRRGFRISADAGIDGAAGVSGVAMAGCQPR
jgi:hypothetical protein